MFKVVKNTRKNSIQRRSSSPSSREETVHQNQPNENTFDTFFDAESASAFQKPWLRVERGLRMQRFKLFADQYPGLSTVERQSLLKVLIHANDAKLLNTKQQIQYEDGYIVSIKGLKMNRVGDSPATFKIDPVRPTKKKKDIDASVSATTD
jgi:hypothetical protein